MRTCSGQARDPRGWSTSTVYYALVPWALLEPWWVGRAAGAGELMLADVDADPPALRQLAFDHGRILQVAIERLRAEAEYSALPCLLLPAHFTLPQMHAIYQVVRREHLDKASFRRKVNELGFIEEVTGLFDSGGRRRPAQLYRLKDAANPMLFRRTL